MKTRHILTYLALVMGLSIPNAVWGTDVKEGLNGGGDETTVSPNSVRFVSNNGGHMPTADSPGSSHGGTRVTSPNNGGGDDTMSSSSGTIGGGSTGGSVATVLVQRGVNKDDHTEGGDEKRNDDIKVTEDLIRRTLRGVSWEALGIEKFDIDSLDPPGTKDDGFRRRKKFWGWTYWVLEKVEWACLGSTAVTGTVAKAGWADDAQDELLTASIITTWLAGICETGRVFSKSRYDKATSDQLSGLAKALDKKPDYMVGYFVKNPLLFENMFMKQKKEEV